MLLAIAALASFLLPASRRLSVFPRRLTGLVASSDSSENLPGLTYDDITSWLQEQSGEAAALTYGEITPRGFQTLAARLQLGPSETFADLGSGHGKAVAQAVTEFGVAGSVGVEITRSRHEMAASLRATLPSSEAERVHLVCGDCASAEVWQAGQPLAEVTVAYAASLLFDRELLERLAARLAGAPRLRTVATLRRFPGGLRGFEEREPPEHCEMSWTAKMVVPSEPDGRHPGSPVYVYERTASAESVAEMRELIDSELPRDSRD